MCVFYFVGCFFFGRCFVSFLFLSFVVFGLFVYYVFKVFSVCGVLMGGCLMVWFYM